MTEAEAKKRWCPFARVVQYAGDWHPPAAGNREAMQAFPDELNGATVCIASSCMAWRWETEPFPNHQPGETGPSAGSGYCGLAGKL